MTLSRFSLPILAAAGLLSLTLPALAETPATPAFKISQTVPLGGTDKWDYLQFDQATHRLFIAHGPEVTVVDGESGHILGRIEGLTGTHGVTLLPGLGRGFVTNNGQATAFDLATLAKVKDIAADKGSDSIITDTLTNRVFVMNGKSQNITAIDPVTSAVLGKIEVGGKPEFVSVDGKGALFVNIEDKSEVVRVDTQSLKIDARWSIPQCDEPHGQAIDAQSRRLFVGCVNERLLVLDADSGAVVATLPIGKGSDAVVFDPKRQIVFSSNGEGTLSMIAETAPDSFVVLPPAPTEPGARTMALNPETGRIFLVTATPDKAATPASASKFLPGTVRLLVLDPQ